MSISREEKEYMEILQLQINEMERRVREVRAIKHDMYAHLMVIRHYLDSKQYEEARSYLSKVMNVPVFHNTVLFDTGNDLVNVLLAERLKKSSSEIQFSVNGMLPEELWIDEMDLCTLFSNLISNSIEACEKLTDQRKTIELVIEDYIDGVSICIKNPVEGVVDKEQLGKSTTKENREAHGYGLENIRKVAERYHGELKIDYQNGLVLVKIDLSCVA